MDHNKTVFTTPSERELLATRAFDAPRQMLWEVWTRCEHVRYWMLGPEGWSMPICQIDLRVGGAWHFGWSAGKGIELEMHGVYREIVPPEQLVNTECWGQHWPETLNTLIFSEENGRTTTVCTVLYASQEAREAAIATGMKDGWSASYDLLDKYLLKLRQTKQPSASEGRKG